jgi:hypothetical protein
MGISLTNMEKCQRTKWTFAIHTNRHTNPKLQKSYFFSTQNHVIRFEYYDEDNKNKARVLANLQCRFESLH